MITEYLRESISGGRSRETLQSFSKLVSPQRTVHGYTTYAVTQRTRLQEDGHTSYTVTQRTRLQEDGYSTDAAANKMFTVPSQCRDVRGSRMFTELRRDSRMLVTNGLVTRHTGFHQMLTRCVCLLHVQVSTQCALRVQKVFLLWLRVVKSSGGTHRYIPEVPINDDNGYVL